MKKQRKLLNRKEQNRICINARSCAECPLSINIIGSGNQCYAYVNKVQEIIKKYWNEEIEVDE